MLPISEDRVCVQVENVNCKPSSGFMMPRSVFIRRWGLSVDISILVDKDDAVCAFNNFHGLFEVVKVRDFEELSALLAPYSFVRISQFQL